MALPMVFHAEGAHAERRHASVLQKMPPPAPKRAEQGKSS
jgi:hypothetical protein